MGDGHVVVLCGRFLWPYILLIPQFRDDGMIAVERSITLEDLIRVAVKETVGLIGGLRVCHCGNGGIEVHGGGQSSDWRVKAL